MIHKKFRHDMKRGLGSCGITLESCANREEYREDVLWGIKNALAYDAQCEGTRAAYLFDMITMFEDRSAFFAVAAAGAQRSLKDSGWKFAHYAELLTLMAGEGNADATCFLDEIYDGLLRTIKNSREAFAAVDNFSNLCVYRLTHTLETTEEKETFFLRVLSDYGRMVRRKPSESARFEDEWFEQVAAEQLGEEHVRQLSEQAGNDPCIAEYLRNKSRLAAECEAYQKQRQEAAAIADAVDIGTKLREGDRLGQGISLCYLRRKLREGHGEEIRELGSLYARETDESLRASMLDLFRTEDVIALLTEDAISQLFKDVESESEGLREQARRVAGDVRHEKARQYALERLCLCPKDADALYMLLSNFHAGDGKYLIFLVRSVSLSEGRGDWHGIFMAVRDLIERDPEADRELSAALLPYMLREGYCSCCRLEILKMMQKRGLLTPKIMQECRWDCNPDIRGLQNEAEDCPPPA